MEIVVADVVLAVLAVAVDEIVADADLVDEFVSVVVVVVDVVSAVLVDAVDEKEVVVDLVDEVVTVVALRLLWI